MRHIGRPLLLLHPDPRFRAQVREAAGREFVVRIIPSWSSLAEELTGISPGSVIVVDPYTGTGAHTQLEPRLHEWLRAYPFIAVVAALEPNARRMRDVHTLGSWGVDEVITTDDDVAVIARTLRHVRPRPLQRLLERILPGTVPIQASSILAAAAEVVTAGGQATALARVMHLSMRTLNRRFEATGLLPPRQTLVWLRILLAAMLLEETSRSIESVAYACGYASDSGLRRAFHDTLHLSPGEVRRRGAVATVAAAFREQFLNPDPAGANTCWSHFAGAELIMSSVSS